MCVCARERENERERGRDRGEVEVGVLDCDLGRGHPETAMGPQMSSSEYAPKLTAVYRKASVST